MRFSDSTTIHDFLLAIAPELAHVEARDELTRGQECLGAACAFAQTHPESQTARDLLDWADGSTPGGCVERARAETIEEWIAPEDMTAFEALPA